jgi:hypothetical protein
MRPSHVPATLDRKIPVL